MRKILIPLDNSKVSFASVEHVKELFNPEDVEITLFSIASLSNNKAKVVNHKFSVDGTILDFEEVLKKSTSELQKVCNKAKEELKDFKVNIEIVENLSSNFGKTILDYAKESSTNLIVMGSKGAGSLSHRLTIGSVALKVLHSANIPVLIVK